MRIFEDEKTDRFGNYPAVWIKGKEMPTHRKYMKNYTRDTAGRGTNSQ